MENFERIDVVVPTEVQFSIEAFDRNADQMPHADAIEQLKRCHYSMQVQRLVYCKLIERHSKAEAENLALLSQERVEHKKTIATLEAATRELAIQSAALIDRSETLRNLEQQNEDLRAENQWLRLEIGVLKLEEVNQLRGDAHE